MPLAVAFGAFVRDFIVQNDGFFAGNLIVRDFSLPLDGGRLASRSVVVGDNRNGVQERHGQGLWTVSPWCSHERVLSGGQHCHGDQARNVVPEFTFWVWNFYSNLVLD